MLLRLAFALTMAALSGAPALAGQATGQFGITLVIAPRCTDAVDPAQETTGVAATRAQALDLAAAELGLPSGQLVVAHDRIDTGWWIVSRTSQQQAGSGSVPVLRIEKCSGVIERL